MIIERAMTPDWLSNTYLVAAAEGGDALLVDAGGPMDELIAKADEHDLTVTHVLLTHHHGDHVAELGKALERWPDAEVLIHAGEREHVMGATGDLEPDAELELAGLTVRTLHTPGHTNGMLSLLIEGNVFTGDTLFKNSVGGVRAPGSTSYADLKHSVMDVLLALPPETTIRPGHTDPTTVADELENNRFVRIWRGVDEEGSEPCTALGEPATLILLGDDYDGGHKAWVRWPDGRDDIVPGSKVERGSSPPRPAASRRRRRRSARSGSRPGRPRRRSAAAPRARQGGTEASRARRRAAPARPAPPRCRRRDGHVVVARAEVVGLLDPAVDCELEHIAVAREPHVQVVRGLEVQPPARLEAQRLVEAHGGLGIADAQAGMDVAAAHEPSRVGSLA